MIRVLLAAVLLVLPQAAPPAPPHEVRRVYWELLRTLEVRVRLAPLGSAGKPLPVDFVFQAFFPGRAERDWNTGEPQWPKGQPERIAFTVQAFPLTLTTDLSVRLVVDGAAVDLTGPGQRFRNIPCLIASDSCVPTGVDIDVDRSLLARLIDSRSVRGQALGFGFELTGEDRKALAAFAARIGLR